MGPYQQPFDYSPNAFPKELRREICRMKFNRSRQVLWIEWVAPFVTSYKISGDCSFTTMFIIWLTQVVFVDKMHTKWVGEWEWLLNVICNDISVIYVTAHRGAGGLNKFDVRSGSQRYRHFVEFSNVPVQAPTRANPFIRLFLETGPHLVAFFETLGIRRTHSRLYPRVPTGVAHEIKWFS